MPDKSAYFSWPVRTNHREDEAEVKIRKSRRSVENWMASVTADREGCTLQERPALAAPTPKSTK